jgi:hypothetical protein
MEDHHFFGSGFSQIGFWNLLRMSISHVFVGGARTGNLQKTLYLAFNKGCSRAPAVPLQNLPGLSFVSFMESKSGKPHLSRDKSVLVSQYNQAKARNPALTICCGDLAGRSSLRWPTSTRSSLQLRLCALERISLASQIQSPYKRV